MQKHSMELPYLVLVAFIYTVVALSMAAAFIMAAVWFYNDVTGEPLCECPPPIINPQQENYKMWYADNGHYQTIRAFMGESN